MARRCAFFPVLIIRCRKGLDFQCQYSQQCMERASSRPKIFAQWPVQQASLQKLPNNKAGRNKYNESIRAEKLLDRTLLLVANIEQYIQEKKTLEEIIRQYSKNSIQFRQRLESLSQQRGRAYNQSEYSQVLQEFHSHLAEERDLQVRLNIFTKQVVSNYDPNVTFMQSRRSQQEVYEEIKRVLAEIKRKKYRLQQALTMYQENIKPSPLLAESFQFDKCFQSLEEELSEDKMVNLHYLMLSLHPSNEQSLIYQFQGKVDQDEKAYCFFEGIYDAMQLMDVQAKFIAKQEFELTNRVGKLNYSTAPEFVPELKQNTDSLNNNLKVYEGNLDTLARINAETSLPQYTSRRQTYISKLNSFRATVTEWTDMHDQVISIYECQTVFMEYQKKKALVDPSLLNKEKESLKTAYYKCVSCQAEGFAQEYKNDALTQMKKIIDDERIPMADHKAIFPPTEAKYLNFFTNLNAVPVPLKAEHLWKCRSKIKENLYELQMTESTNRVIVFSFKYCQAIALHYEKFCLGSFERGSNPMDATISYFTEVKELLAKKWTQFPVGFDTLLYHYTSDVIVAQEALSEMGYEHSRKGDSNGWDPLTGEFVSFVKNLPLVLQAQPGQVQPTANIIKLSIGARRDFYSRYYRKITPYGTVIKQKLEDIYWQKILAGVMQCYDNRADSNASLERVQMDHFYDFSTLARLTKKKQKLVLSNHGDITENYLKIIQRREKHNWSQEQLIIEIIRQKLYLKFLQVQSFGLDLSAEKYAIRKVNKIFTLLYETNDHLESQQSVQLQAFMEQALKIEKDWAEVQQMEKFSKDYLVDRCRSILKQYRREIVKFGTELGRKIDQLLPYVNVKEKLAKLNAIKNLWPANWEFFICVCFCRTSYLLSFAKETLQFKPSQTISIRQNEASSINMQKLQEYVQREVQQKINPELNAIMSIFSRPGEQAVQGKMSGRMPSTTNDPKGWLQQIICRLQA